MFNSSALSASVALVLERFFETLVLNVAASHEKS
jgi:hypothetical protein